MITQEPSKTATAGQVFGTQPVVKEEDQYGNVITGDSTSTVTAARGDVGTSTLLGNKLTVTLVKGVATFSGLSYNKAESMDIAFTSNITGVSPATSSQVVVARRRPASSSSTSSRPRRRWSASRSRPSPSSTRRTSSATSRPETTPRRSRRCWPAASGPLQGPATVTVSGGVARFSGLYDNTAETITLDFGSGTLLSAASNPIVVGPAIASHARHPHPALRDRDGRPGVHGPAGTLPGGRQRQYRDG